MAAPVDPAEKAALALAEARAAVAAAEEALARQAAPVALVIDDSEDSRDLYAQYLGLHGFRVLSAADGPDGLAIARDIHPDAIVLDLGLPIVDGWEVARQLRADPVLKDLCIVACSGFAAGEDEQRAIEAGVNAFLTKPCDPQRVLDAIVKNLKRT